MAVMGTHHHSEFPAARLAAERSATVSVCLPAGRDEEATIGPILDAIMPLMEIGMMDQVVVADELHRRYR
ncbi:MAG: hypothetical protein WKF32_00925 [Thermoleophilaceae bacterium]